MEGASAHAGLPTAGGIESKPFPLQPVTGTRGAGEGKLGCAGEAAGVTLPWLPECADHGAGQADFANLFMGPAFSPAVGADGYRVHTNIYAYIMFLLRCALGTPRKQETKLRPPARSYNEVAQIIIY